MAEAGMTGGFKFVQQAEFDRLVNTRALAPGTFYYTPTLFYLARTNDTYYTYGGASVQEIVTELLQRETFTTELIESFSTNETFRQTVVQTLMGDVTFQAFVSELLLTDEDFRAELLLAISSSLTRQTIINVINDVVSVVAPDGSSIAVNTAGRLTLQLATNNQFGIVKGQDNNSLTTWHNTSIANGIPSVNRGQIESVMDTKDNVIKNSINVRAEDNCIVGRNENGTIILPIRQVATEPATPAAGTMYLINEHADTP